MQEELFLMSRRLDLCAELQQKSNTPKSEEM